MDPGRVGSPTRALPFKRMQHITSTSIPSIALGDKHLPRLSYSSIVPGDLDHSPSATLKHVVLSSPSNCLFLGNSAKRTSPDQSRRTRPQTKIRESSKDLLKREDKFSKTLLLKKRSFTVPRLHVLAAQNKSADEKEQFFSSTQHSQLGRSAKLPLETTSNFSKKMTQTFSSTMSSMPSRRAPEEALPPLVKFLEHYIHREVGAAMENGAPLTAQERLQPFREAFFVFIDAFPAYGKILNDILSAYDGVIQEQAKIITDVIAEGSRHHFEEEKHLFEMGELKKTIKELTSELDEARIALAEEEMGPDIQTTATTEGKPFSSARPSSSLRLRSAKESKMLAEANQRISELEKASKSDLEKHLVLINALRESDKRAKALENELAMLNTELDTLTDFKKMAGEAQKQLEELQVKYQNFVSIHDHELIKECLTAELQAAQNLARHYRRSAAVRGTQVDVIVRKLKAVQEENVQLIKNTEDDRVKILTPRPDWGKIHSSLPDLKEIASPITALSVEGDEAITSTVPGLSETRTQVDYLVECINSLSQELKRRSMVLMPMKTPSLPLIGQGVESHVPLHLRACGIIPRVNLDPVEILLLIHDFFHDVLQPHPDVLLRKLDVPRLYNNFLKEQIQKREPLKQFSRPEHLAINLAEIAKDKEACRPSLLLLDGMLSGIFPARIASDVILVLENVRLELKGLGEAQRKARISRIAINDCLKPLMRLKTPEDVAAIKKTLGSDSTHDIETLCSTGGKFMLTLLDQECASGMDFYIKLVKKLSSYAYYADSPDGELVISLDNVGRAIAEAEPLTPSVIIKEITEKSATNNVEKKDQTTLLSDVLHILAAAPLIRRTAQFHLDKEIS